MEWCSTGRFICECDAPKDLGKVQSIHNVKEGRFCAIKSDGHLQCWGKRRNFFSGIIDFPPDLGPVRSISISREQTCAVKKDGFVRYWDRIARESPVPDDLSHVREVSLGYQSGPYACAITIENKVKCWQEDFTKRLNYLKVPE